MEIAWISCAGTLVIQIYLSLHLETKQSVYGTSVPLNALPQLIPKVGDVEGKLSWFVLPLRGGGDILIIRYSLLVKISLFLIAWIETTT